MSLLLLFFSLILLPLLLFLSYRALFPTPTKPNSPPSPKGLPILGNLLQLGALPHRSLQSLAQAHAAPLMFLRMGRGAPTLVVSSADAAREVLKKHDLAFASRGSSKFTASITYGRNVSFSPYGEYWRLAKKAAVVHLLSPKRVLSFRPLRDEHLALMLSRISSSVAEGGAVDLSGVLQTYSHGLIIAAATGRGTAAVEGIREMQTEASVLFAKFQMFEAFPWLGWMTRVAGLDARLAWLARRWDGFMTSVLEEHAARGGQEKEEEELDFVDLLLGLWKSGTSGFLTTDNDIKALAMDMIAAGSDTSYIVIEWAMAELLRNPRTMNAAQHDVRGFFSKEKPILTEDDVSQMTYLKAVIKEALRLHPPAPLLVPHESISEATVQGFQIPAKTTVIINGWAIGRDPRSWECPEEFRPARFLGSSVDYKGVDFQLIPFGAGRRVCPGIHFAMASVELALANLLYCFDWRLPDGMRPEDLDMAEVAGLTTPKKVGLRLIATPPFS